MSVAVPECNEDLGMAQNFSVCDREEELLLPPSLREWLPEGHLAWCVIDAVAQFDLAAFYGDYRDDGHGRPAHDAAMMVALLLYCYAARETVVAADRAALHRGCRDARDHGQSAPDHATIARFRQRRETALAGLCGAGLALCAEVSLVRVGVIRSTGRRFMRTRPSGRRAITSRSREILAEADAVDREEDERFGERCGDELPEQLATGSGAPVAGRSQAFAWRSSAPTKAGQFRPHGASSPRGAPSSVEKQTG